LALDARFAKNQDRVRHRAELVPVLQEIFLTRPKAAWLSALEQAKVPCGAINDLSEVFADPHVQARGMVTHWQHAVNSHVPLVTSPIKLSATPVRTDRAPPTLGQHTDEVLNEVLGLSPVRLAELRASGTL
jgi:crotonobetainyl-CoA:carnitine CoA-transferase CaiB-like acyl-CoA transferase